MSKSQRTKGAVFEREVCKRFSTALGVSITRNIGQSRDGGNDIDVGPLVVECKRRAKLGTVMSWLQQAQAAAANRAMREPDHSHIPVVVGREDNGRSIVILDLDDFISLTREKLLEPVVLGHFGED